MNLYRSNKKSGPTINVQSSKTVTAGTSQQTFAPDTGYDAMGEVVVNPTPSQSKSVTAGTTTTTVTPDNGKLLSSVSIAPTPSTPITPSSSGTQFSAGLNNMSSSGWAYSSQPSTGTIKYVPIVSPIQDNTHHTFTLSNNNYNLISSGKAILIAGIKSFQATLPSQGSIGGNIQIGFNTSLGLNIIDSSNIGSNKTIYYRFTIAAPSAGGDGFIYLVYIE